MVRAAQAGHPGGKLWRLIRERLPFEQFGIFLNPGHLIHLDEWLSSPDISELGCAPSFGHGDPGGCHSQFADIFFDADGGRCGSGRQRAAQAAEECFPDCYARCQKRRKFMAEVLGFELPEEICRSPIYRPSCRLFPGSKRDLCVGAVSEIEGDAQDYILGYSQRELSKLAEQWSSGRRNLLDALVRTRASKIRLVVVLHGSIHPAPLLSR